MRDGRDGTSLRWPNGTAPEWHDNASRYAMLIADQMGAQLAVEPFNAGRSFETNHARARFTKGGLSIIVDITESDELFVESDKDAILYAFRKADPFDGGFATIPIDKIRQAYRLHFTNPSN